jgi:hypothetical protein
MLQATTQAAGADARGRVAADGDGKRQAAPGSDDEEGAKGPGEEDEEDEMYDEDDDYNQACNACMRRKLL